MKTLLQEQMKDAMRSKDKVRLETIRALLAAIQYAEMESGKSELKAEEYPTLLQREIKKRKEEIEFAEKAGRTEAKDKVLLEIKAIESFLPQQLSDAEIETLIVSMKEDNASLNLGLAIKNLRETHAGQFDGKRASEIAKRVIG